MNPYILLIFALAIVGWGIWKLFKESKTGEENCEKRE